MELKSVVGASCPQWISVKDRLPESDVMVLVFDIDGDVGIDYMEKNHEWSCYNSFEVTHWMPLPEPPRR